MVVSWSKYEWKDEAGLNILLCTCSLENPAPKLPSKLPGLHTVRYRYSPSVSLPRWGYRDNRSWIYSSRASFLNVRACLHEQPFHPRYHSCADCSKNTAFPLFGLTSKPIPVSVLESLSPSAWAETPLTLGKYVSPPVQLSLRYIKMLPRRL